MEKLLDILKQMKNGVSTEFMEAFAKELDGWKNATENSVKKTVQEDYEKKLVRAKEVCLAETNKFKTELARRVEVFLEARVGTINREAQKQSAIGESEAAKTLRGVKSLIEGVAIDMPDTQVVEENKKLRAKIGQMQEEKHQLEEKNKHANIIARKLIDRQRVLESKLGTTVVEHKETPAPKTDLKSMKEEGARPQTTRAVAPESVAKETKKSAPGNSDVMAIAEGLDGTPATMVMNG